MRGDLRVDEIGPGLRRCLHGGSDRGSEISESDGSARQLMERWQRDRVLAARALVEYAS